MDPPCAEADVESEAGLCMLETHMQMHLAAVCLPEQQQDLNRESITRRRASSFCQCCAIKQRHVKGV